MTEPLSHEQQRQLEEEFLRLVRLQAHYAFLLNCHDGGERERYRTRVPWIDELIEQNCLPVQAVS